MGAKSLHRRLRCLILLVVFDIRVSGSLLLGGHTLPDAKVERPSWVDKMNRNFKTNVTMAEVRRRGQVRGSYEMYAADMRRRQRTEKIEGRKVTLEGEILAEIRNCDELTENVKDSLIYKMQHAELAIDRINVRMFEQLLGEALDPIQPSKQIIKTLWSKLANATQIFVECQETGRPHPRLVREAQRGRTDAELRRPPPITDVFAARLLIQRLLLSSSLSTSKLNEDPMDKLELEIIARNPSTEGISGKNHSIDIPVWASSPLYTKAEINVEKNTGEFLGKWKIGNKRALVIGREEGADIVALHPTVSRQHALLAHDYEGDIFVMDLKSRYGTQVNGHRVPPNVPIILQEGDTVIFGSSTRRYIICYYRTLREHRELSRVQKLRDSKRVPVGAPEAPSNE